ncbi:MAG: dihydrodipicolinate synthase family protein, partial [Clostridia bacterium]|nr:dihydrodipicolinate synthase family protein [Clostridia bacterium]
MSAKTMAEKIKGIMPALVTPLTQKEEVNVPVLHSLMEHLIKQGAQGFYIGGATGEGILMKREQREILATEGVKAAKGLPSIVHIASIQFDESLALAKQAEAAGATAISAIPPLFYRYSKDDVFDYYTALANAVSIPLMVYYNPFAGFNMDAGFAARLFEIDNVTSIKWTNIDYYEVIRLKNLTHGEMSIINGSDERIIAGLSAGADGGIGTTYHLMVPRSRT